MKKQVLAYAISRPFLFIAGLLLVLGLSSFKEMPPKKVKSDFSLSRFSSDPIRFRMTANKKKIFTDEEIEITITAYYTAVSPALLYTVEGANSFRLKVVPPEGFVQTGGDYIDYCGATLTTASPVARYTLKGYFPRLDIKPLFRLLRGHGQADANSLFVVKDELTLEVRPAPRRSVESLAEATPSAPEPVIQSAARAAFSDCSFDPNTPIISWYGEQIYARQHNGIWYAAYGDGSNFRPQSWVLATGFANYQCFAQTDPRTSSGGNTNNQGSNTPNPADPCSVSRPRGCVDILNGNGISGWALDESDYNKPLLVDIYVNGAKVATVEASDDRSDLVGAFGNNPAARYHGFHTEWEYNGQGTNNYAISVKICGATDPLATGQVSFSDNSPNVRKGVKPSDGITLPEVVVRGEKLKSGGASTGGSGSGSGGGSGSGSGSGSGGGSAGGGGGSSGGGSGSNGNDSTPPKVGMNKKENTCKVLKAIWENSGSFASDGNWWGSKENGALLTSSGILWLPTEGVDQCTGQQDFNNTHSTNLNYLGCLTKENGKVFITYEGNKLEVYATLHTHLNSLEDTVASPPDINNQKNRGIPTYIIGYNNIIKLTNGQSVSVGSRNDVTNCSTNFNFYGQ